MSFTYFVNIISNNILFINYNLLGNVFFSIFFSRLYYIGTIVSPKVLRNNIEYVLLLSSGMSHNL